MEIRVLRYFLTVVREENITRAADILHITQPTLSRQSEFPFAPDKKGHPQFLFQLGELTAQRGLGDMQDVRRPGDVFLPDHGQKIRCV